MPWLKRGRIFATPADAPAWAAGGYASYPTAYERAPGILRVLYTALGANQDGHTAWLEVPVEDPSRVLAQAREPLLAPGALGEFDDCGANVFSVCTWQGRRLYHYQGWQRAAKAPYLVFTGLALQDPAAPDRLRRLQPVPVLERSAAQPTMRAISQVQPMGGRLRAWYMACSAWQLVDGAPRYHVGIHSAVSDDGIAWQADPQPCLLPQADEYAVGRPSVLPARGGGWEMWFSVRSASRPYRMGHARSTDGQHWQRDDDPACLLQASAAGWDSEMVCFPNVIDVQGRRLQFYNGNHHGRSGFGVAEWVD